MLRFTTQPCVHLCIPYGRGVSCILTSILGNLVTVLTIWQFSNLEINCQIKEFKWLARSTIGTHGEANHLECARYYLLRKICGDRSAYYFTVRLKVYRLLKIIIQSMWSWLTVYQGRASLFIADLPDGCSLYARA